MMWYHIVLKRIEDGMQEDATKPATARTMTADDGADTRRARVLMVRMLWYVW